MTHSLAGLLALNALFLAVGGAVVWAVRGIAAWTELLRLAGVAYLAGLAAVCLPVTWLLVIGVPVPVPVVVVVAALVVAACVLWARRQGRTRPVLRLGAVAREPYVLVGVVCAALVVVFLEAFFRVAHLQGLNGGDAASFWTPKAKVIYYLGGLDRHFFAAIPGVGEFPHGIPEWSTYPILLPTLQALDFHFMGSADTTTLHVQMALLLAGFTFAVAGLLRPRVPLVVLWPFLLLFLMMPELEYRALPPQADLTLDYFFVVAALCVALWLESRATWLLVLGALFLGASISTKREGLLMAAALVAGALIVTWREKRHAWPRLASAGLAGFAFDLPWRIWFSAQGFRGEGPPASLSDLAHTLSRALPSLWLVVRLTFSYQLWLVATWLGVAAAVLVLVAGERRLGAVYLLTMALCIAAFTWVLWASPQFPIAQADATPMPRLVGSLVLLSIAFAPLLLTSVLRRVRPG